MGIDAERVLERFKNLLTVKNERYLEEIQATFNDRDLKELIWILNDYIAITKGA